MCLGSHAVAPPPHSCSFSSSLNRLHPSQWNLAFALQIKVCVQERTMKSQLRAYSNKTKKKILPFLLLSTALPCFSQTSPAQRVKRTVLVSIADRQLAVLENGVVLAHF